VSYHPAGQEIGVAQIPNSSLTPIRQGFQDWFSPRQPAQQPPPPLEQHRSRHRLDRSLLPSRSRRFRLSAPCSARFRCRSNGEQGNAFGARTSEIAVERGIALSRLMDEIDKCYRLKIDQHGERRVITLSSAVRIFVTEHIASRAVSARHNTRSRSKPK
jgi:predicted DNA-binding ribbon-helix-helix protein